MANKMVCLKLPSPPLLNTDVDSSKLNPMFQYCIGDQKSRVCRGHHFVKFNNEFILQKEFQGLLTKIMCKMFLLNWQCRMPQKQKHFAKNDF